MSLFLKVSKKSKSFVWIRLISKSAFLIISSWLFLQVKDLESIEIKKSKPLLSTISLILELFEITKDLNPKLWGLIGVIIKLFVFGVSIGPPQDKE